MSKKIDEQLAIMRKKMREFRVMKKMTQLEVGDQAHTTNSTISCYERGKASVPIEVLLTYCEIFGVQMNDFFANDKKDGAKTILSLSNADIELLEKYHKCSPANKKVIHILLNNDASIPQTSTYTQNIHSSIRVAEEPEKDEEDNSNKQEDYPEQDTKHYKK